MNRKQVTTGWNEMLQNIVAGILAECLCCICSSSDLFVEDMGGGGVQKHYFAVSIENMVRTQQRE